MFPCSFKKELPSFFILDCPALLFRQLSQNIAPKQLGEGRAAGDNASLSEATLEPGGRN